VIIYTVNVNLNHLLLLTVDMKQTLPSILTPSKILNLDFN